MEEWAELVLDVSGEKECEGFRSNLCCPLRSAFPIMADLRTEQPED